MGKDTALTNNKIQLRYRESCEKDSLLILERLNSIIFPNMYPLTTEESAAISAIFADYLSTFDIFRIIVGKRGFDHAYRGIDRGQLGAYPVNQELVGIGNRLDRRDR